MKKETKELLTWAEKWTQKITDVTVKYEKGIGKLQQARDSFESAKKSIWERLVGLSPIIMLILLIIFAIFYLFFAPCGSITFKDLTIVKDCRCK